MAGYYYIEPGEQRNGMRKLLRKTGRPEVRSQNSGEPGMSKVDVPSGSKGGAQRESQLSQA